MERNRERSLRLARVMVLMLAAWFFALSVAKVSAYVYSVSIEPSSSVHLGTTVTVKVETNDPNVNKVVFNWYDPTTTLRHTKIVNQNPYEDSLSLDVPGEWEVNAALNNGDVRKVKITVYIDVFVVPEVPLGTATVLVTSLSALGISVAKKKRDITRAINCSC